MARSIYCSKCKCEKEGAVKDESYCKACKSERFKIARQKKRIERGLSPNRPIRRAYCNNCIVKFEAGEDIRGTCLKCHSLAQLERVENQREAKGLPRKSLRDSNFCYVCSIPKVNGRCMPCRAKAAKERKAKKREKAGKRPWGAGRPETCYLCGAIKDNLDTAYCKPCTSAANKKRWKEQIAPIVNVREITLICECGKEKKSTRKLYCDDCLLRRKREVTRETAKRRRKQLKEAGYLMVAIPLTEEQKVRRKAARAYLHSLIRQGLVKRENCCICGESKNVEAHHDDYNKPLEIQWLCKVHHAEQHRNPTFKDN